MEWFDHVDVTPPFSRGDYSTKQLQMNDQLISLFISLDFTKLQTTRRKENDQLICHKNPLADHEKGRTT